MSREGVGRQGVDGQGVDRVSRQPFIHRFVPAAMPALSPLLLLHGTGGDETELLAFAGAAWPGAAILSPRGQVEENGLLRFFRRFSDGTLDEADVRRSADELAAFVTASRARHGLLPPIAIGFSNGANAAAALLQLYPDLLAGAVLLRSVPPLEQPPGVSAAGTPVLLVSGAADAIAPPEKGQALAGMLRACGAAVETHVLDCGHALVEADVSVANEWLRRHAARV